jgi:hypothetical protein
MPHQNRVTPFNEIVAIPARGTMMGNRGVLHDAEGRIARPFAHRNWVNCVLEFKGRHRKVMTPGRYTHLFFLDEVTALAAGHRPCGECRRADYVRYRDALATHLGVEPTSLKAADMDRLLHSDRVTGRGTSRTKPTIATTFGAIPDGVMFTLRDGPRDAWLKWRGRSWRWSADGYGLPRSLDAAQPIDVLTPASTVAAIRTAYVPGVHASAA